MKKVAIVGVEGSGKTVMLAGLGDLYSHPDENGFFLGPKNFQTASYVAEKIARMRKGEWPMATAGDVLQGLDWTLRQRQIPGQRPRDVCEVSCLDFAGEVYRCAFVREDATPYELLDEVQSLKDYVRNADDLIVLINLRDVIVQGEHDPRVQESMWITNAILSYALDEQGGRAIPRAAIVLSQADSYADTIRSCGGPKGVLAKYLPHVANNYDWLDILAASAVDKTWIDDNGNIVPAPDFQPTGLRVIMNWIQAGIADYAPPPRPAPAPQPDFSPPPEPAPVVRRNVNGCVFALALRAAAGSALGCLISGHWGVAIFLGVLFFGLTSERGDSRTKQNAGPWFLCILLLLLAGVLGVNDHWIWASVLGLSAIGVLQK